MNYLIRVWWTDSEGGERTEYYTVQAPDDTQQAEALAASLVENILRAEHFDSDKHSFGYEGRYASGYGGVVGSIDAP